MGNLARMSSSSTQFEQPQQCSKAEEIALKLIAISERLKPGAPLTPVARAFMVKLWAPTITSRGEEAFTGAFNAVMQDSTFRPDIAEIRKVLGIKPAAEILADDSRTALKLVIETMRVRGPKLLAILGAIKNDGLNPDGTVRQVPEREPGEPAPTFSALIEDAIADFGFGDRAEGLRALSEHPAVASASSGQRGERMQVTAGFTERNAAAIEKRWHESYARSHAPIQGAQ